MKKTLALILSLLVAFSMFTVATFAAEDLVTISFVDSDGRTIDTVQVKVDTILTPYAPENPVKESTETTKYTFIGWTSSDDGEVYYKNTLPSARVDVTYTATYSEENISENQTFWSFIASIFERINLIFEYFAEIFRFDN